MNSTRNRSDRRGIAATELAVCLPLLMFLVVGSIEIANAIFLRQALTTAAFEAAQVATSASGSQSAATARATEITSAFGIALPTVVISPAVTTSTASGTVITVTVSAPIGSNGVLRMFTTAGASITGRAVMVRL